MCCMGRGVFMPFFKAKLISNLKAPLIAVLLLASAQSVASAAEQPQASSAKPKIIEFYASWSTPCQRLQASMDRAMAQHADEFEFVSYNVDDPAAQEALKKYEVCPIPTLVFVNEKNQISDYSIGCMQENILEKKINSALNHKS